MIPSLLGGGVGPPSGALLVSLLAPACYTSFCKFLNSDFGGTLTFLAVGNGAARPMEVPGGRGWGGGGLGNGGIGITSGSPRGG